MHMIFADAIPHSAYLRWLLMFHMLKTRLKKKKGWLFLIMSRNYMHKIITKKVFSKGNKLVLVDFLRNYPQQKTKKRLIFADAMPHGAHVRRGALADLFLDTLAYNAHSTGCESLIVATRCNTLQRTTTHCNTLQHIATHCNALQRTASHCNTLKCTATHCNAQQHTATHCNELQRTAMHCNTLQHTATHCNTLQRTERSATHCNALQCTGTHCNTLQHTAKHWNTMQCTATHCNTLQHTATHYKGLALIYFWTFSRIMRIVPWGGYN